MKGKGIKFRDLDAISAQFRNSSGAMKVKRQQEERQACRDFRKNWRHEVEDADENFDDLKNAFEFQPATEEELYTDEDMPGILKELEELEKKSGN